MTPNAISPTSIPIEPTFNPQDPETPTAVTDESNQGLDAMACPSTVQCTTVDQFGNEITFDPEDPGTPDPVSVSGDPLVAVSCPTISQCTATSGSDSGDAITFNPGGSGAPTVSAIDAGNYLNAVACPTTTQCTAVDLGGQQLTFDPQTSDAPIVSNIAAGTALYGIACPVVAQCSAVDYTGHEITGLIARPTATSVTCSPTNPVVGKPVACTVTVGDSGAGQASAPRGTVTFTASAGSAALSSSLVCTLVPTGSITSTCSVSFAPPTVGSYTVTGSYAGDSADLASSGQSGAITATAAPSPVDPTPVRPAPPGRVTVAGTAAVSRTGVATLLLTCRAGGGVCRGRLLLQVKLEVKIRRRGKTVVRSREVILGAANYALGVGAPATLHLKLSRTNLMRFRRDHDRFRSSVVIASEDGTRRVVTVTMT